ncbi:NUDIX hydrolase [Sphingomonas sp. GC_Shp_3]|uniref:NUDIX domain-containing protein n=1 Tax=Sphingomonas sp. GC_Shp_3 TaxID=2937383 RepID=UPI00226A3324|nr:NUDIX hydrolase [Sphingomonas sp. GC_Shp_3]
MFTIDSVRAIYQGWLNLVMVRLRAPDGTTFDRHVVEVGRAVAVLPYNPTTGMALLVSMPRAPVMLLGQADLLEAIAGKLESDDPEDCTRREALEEGGVQLGHLDHIGQFWTIPAIATERLDYYLAEYADADRGGPGGGLAQEHENITVHELPLAELWARYERGHLPDAKLVTLLFALRLRHPHLFG